VVEIDPKLWTIETAVGKRRPASQAAGEMRSAFAINTNFFDEKDNPMGAVVIAGNEVRSPRPVSWQSIFVVSTKGVPAIVTPARWRSVKATASAAVQAGPRLVVDGKKNDVARASPSFRSGVCITPRREIRFFVTPRDRLFDVHQMVDLALKPESDDGLGCRDAMLFDGGPSAQVYLSTPSLKIELDGDDVPVYLTARKR
jgi:uncharacterized protein YigE (DUF2233 family)